MKCIETLAEGTFLGGPYMNKTDLRWFTSGSNRIFSWLGDPKIAGIYSDIF
jgi:hypothetical protein